MKIRSKARMGKIGVFFLFFCVFAACAAPALAGAETEKQGLSLVLIAPDSSDEKPLSSGRQAHFTVLFTNPGPQALPIPGMLRLSFTAEGKDPVQAEARPAQATNLSVPAGGFLNAAYEFPFPDTLTGPVRIKAVGEQTNTVIVYAGKPKENLAQISDEDPKPILKYTSNLQPFFVNFYPYKPVYFLFGADPGIEESTFQLSFKYKLFNFEEDGKGKSFLEKIFLAYTQQSFWDLESDSAPFEDSRYMPEIFYYEDDLGIKLPYLIGSGLQIGYQHESNGRAGDLSRSTNYAYLQPVMVFKFGQDLVLGLRPKAWVYVNNDNATNGDLADYRGYFDLEATIGFPEGLALDTHFRHGREGSTWQLDLSYPLDQIAGLVGLPDIYLHVRFYSGYSEQMLEYDQREDVILVGFSLVR